MIEIIPTGTFDEWQQALDTEFSKSAESFIRIGYLLKWPEIQIFLRIHRMPM